MSESSFHDQVTFPIPAGTLTWPPIVATTFDVSADTIDSNMLLSLQICVFAELSQMIVAAAVSSKSTK